MNVKSVKNTTIAFTQSSFVDWDECFKVEDIKEELKEEESVDDSLFMRFSTEIVAKQEIKEEVKDLDEEQGGEDSNVDTGNLVNCSEYVQVQMNLTK